MKDILKNIFCIIVLANLFAACNTKEVKNTENVSDLLEKKVREDSVVNTYISTINSIQDNLDSIKLREKIIAQKSSGNDFESQKEQIENDLIAIHRFMDMNKTKVQALTAYIQKRDGKIDEANKTIEGIQRVYDRINHDVEMRDMELKDIKNYLGKINNELIEVTATLNEKNKENAKKTNELNTAFYAIGTSQELKSRGIITNEGGFIGIGATLKMKDDFKRTSFSKINITVASNIAINAKSAKIITTHPAISYKVNGDKKHVESIDIISPKEFWGASKYLVILVTE